MPGKTMQITDEALTEHDVRDFLNWRYPAPYQIYNLEVQNVDDAITFFLAPENGYLAVQDNEGSLVGFCCFGLEGQVPGGDYSRRCTRCRHRHEAGTDRARAGLCVCGRSADPCRADLRTATATRHRGRCSTGVRSASLRTTVSAGKSQFLSTTARPREYVILVKEVGNVD